MAERFVDKYGNAFEGFDFNAGLYILTIHLGVISPDFWSMVYMFNIAIDFPKCLEMPQLLQVVLGNFLLLCGHSSTLSNLFQGWFIITIRCKVHIVHVYVWVQNL